jgi:THO complex subunit 4
MNYNSEGKSKGIATVVFQRPGDAGKAYQEYHNRTLDSRAMKIELIVNPDVIKALPSRPSGGIDKKYLI